MALPTAKNPWNGLLFLVSYNYIDPFLIGQIRVAEVFLTVVEKKPARSPRQAFSLTQYTVGNTHINA